MLKTVKLYETDPYQQTFEAEIIKQLTIDNQPAVVLNQTAFYPLGGGQEADRGTLNGIAVSDVIERDGVIYHLLERALDKTQVSGQIDWARRYDHMQQHTGEHILSGLVLERLGLNNVGFHIGHDLMRVDYDEFIDWPVLLELERDTNRMIQRNLNLTSHIYQPGDPDYRFKKELQGDIRVVDIPGVDRCACCGTHVATTCEVGLLKIVEAERYKGGVRLGIVCGQRAIDYFQKLLTQTKQLMQLTSAQTFGLVPAVEKKYLEQHLKDKQLADMERRLVDLLIDSYSRQSEPIILFEQLGPKATANLAQALALKAPWVAIFHPGEDNQHRFYLHSKQHDMAELAHRMLARFDGKGGGRGQTSQGSLKGSAEEIIEWMRNLS